MINIKKSQIENCQDEKNTTESEAEYTKDMQAHMKQRETKHQTSQLKFNLIVKQQNIVKKKIQKLFRRRMIQRLDKELLRNQANQAQLKRFQRKYPLTYQKSFQQESTQMLKHKLFTKLSAEDLTCFSLEDYEYNIEDLKKDEEVIRMSNVVRVIDILKIIEYLIKLKGNSTFIYENKVQKTIPFHIYSEVVFVTQSYFKLDKIKNAYNKFQDVQQQEQFFQREYEGVSQKDQRSFYQKNR